MRDFNSWLGKMRASINADDYDVDFPKVYAIVDPIKLELIILKYIIGWQSLKNLFLLLICQRMQILS